MSKHYNKGALECIESIVRESNGIPSKNTGTAWHWNGDSGYSCCSGCTEDHPYHCHLKWDASKIRDKISVSPRSHNHHCPLPKYQTTECDSWELKARKKGPEWARRNAKCSCHCHCHCHCRCECCHG